MAAHATSELRLLEATRLSAAARAGEPAPALTLRGIGSTCATRRFKLGRQPSGAHLAKHDRKRGLQRWCLHALPVSSEHLRPAATVAQACLALWTRLYDVSDAPMPKRPERHLADWIEQSPGRHRRAFHVPVQ